MIKVLSEDKMLIEYRNDQIHTSPGQSGAALYLIKHQADCLEDLRTAFLNQEFKLDYTHTELIGIHDGSSEDRMTNFAAKIDREMFFTFIYPSILNLLLNIWPNERKEKIHDKVKANLQEMGQGQTKEEESIGRQTINTILELSSDYKKNLLDNQLLQETDNQAQNI